MTTGPAIAGKYHLLRPLGKGSMGEVWAAMHAGLGREVALKLIYEGSAELAARLKREAQACGRLEHPNIVRVYDYGETETGDPFLVMELLTGETLADRIADKERLPAVEAVSIILDVARALCAAHDAGIVHRDLKPANVFLCKSAHGEAVKVLDFGVSKILAVDDMGVTSTGALVGSPAYMSPEQARALREIDPRADLWSVGVLLFEMLTGTRPFPSPTVVGVVADILAGPIPALASALPGVDPRLDHVVRWCMTRELDRRMPSAAKLIETLTPVLESLRAPPAPPPAPAPSQPQAYDIPLDPTDPDEASTVALPAAMAPRAGPRLGGLASRALDRAPAAPVPAPREEIADEPSDSDKETNVLRGAAGAAMRAVVRAALANRAPAPQRPAPPAVHVVEAPAPAPRPDVEEASAEAQEAAAEAQEATIPTRIIANPFAARAPQAPPSNPGAPSPVAAQAAQGPGVPAPPPSQPQIPRNMTIPMGSPWNLGLQRPPPPAPQAIQTWPTQPPDATETTRLVLPRGWRSTPNEARRMIWITAIAGIVVGLVVFAGISLLR